MLTFLKDLNLCYLILVILSIITLNIFISKNNLQRRLRYIINILYILIIIFSFNYINGIINNIFKLNYLSVKLYLVMIMISNLIFLNTINHSKKASYTLLNYFMFILLTIIFGATLSVILGNKYEVFYIMDIANAVIFIDLSFVIFLFYLILLSLIVIGYYLFDNNTSIKLSIKDIDLSGMKNKYKYFKDKKKSNILTEEELLNYNINNGLYIDGVECSIIFEDSNKYNIIKNYHILLNDINAKLVNGYTLEENIMLKNIYSKLQVSSIKNIDISNVSILNKISVDEYKLLRKVFGLN